MRKTVEQVIQDRQGRILGKVSRLDDGREWMREDIETVRAFLTNVTKQHRGVETMSEQPKVNQVKLSGIIKSHSVKESSGFGLIDPQTEGSRFIAVSINESKELADKWKTFGEGDYVQIVGFIRSWSKKLDNGGWQNNTEVRITSIVNTGSGKKKQGPPASDDSLPF